MNGSSMYAQLIRQAIDNREPSEEERTRGEALAELLRCRVRLGVATHADSGWASSAVADQLAYDLALIDFAQFHGIDCDPFEFGQQPQKERVRLETALASRGDFLGDLDVRSLPEQN